MSLDQPANKKQQGNNADASGEPSAVPEASEAKNDRRKKQRAGSWNEKWGKELIDLIEKEPFVGIGLVLALIIIGIAIGGIIHPFAPYW
jgi:uncharacterized membrane protein YraQ (UPF0718 family)